MQVTVLYFAIARERAGGTRSEAVELPAGGSLDDLRTELARRHPDLAPLLDRVRLAVNESFATAGQPLADGDEVAVIPPVSGGA